MSVIVSSLPFVSLLNRALIFSAVQSIEIALRTKIIHNFSLVHGPFWFMNNELMKSTKQQEENLLNLSKELSRSKEDFIKEHFQKSITEKKVSHAYIIQGELGAGKDKVEIAVVKITDDEVTIEVEGKEKVLKADTVIKSIGYNDQGLESNDKFHVIGDADKVGNLKDVIWTAYDLANRL